MDFFDSQALIQMLVNSSAGEIASSATEEAYCCQCCCHVSNSCGARSLDPSSVRIDQNSEKRSKTFLFPFHSSISRNVVGVAFPFMNTSGPALLEASTL